MTFCLVEAKNSSLSFFHLSTFLVSLQCRKLPYRCIAASVREDFPHNIMNNAVPVSKEDDAQSLREGWGPADPTVVAEIAKRYERISTNTGMAGMSDDMSRHFRRSVQGIPRAEARNTYIDEGDSVDALFNHGKILDEAQLRGYAKELKSFERHSREGRESFEQFLRALNEAQEADERRKAKSAQSFERHAAA
jgi:hypothetical protein